ncbi:MAG: aspartate kinase, partial [Candidatus Obscuribacterales bacterium]|nr:aspartate kinase [Candidatus Obscuribacterales bacterium]
MEEIAVLKFGGTSVKNVARIHHVAELISKFPAKKKLVIVSAMGDTTDNLIKLAKQCSPDISERELDLLLATGEQVSITLLAIALGSHGIKAKSFTGNQLGILTDSSHTAARIIDIDRNLLNNAIDENDVVVIAGFQGCSEEGEVTTLGRGGSDTSAVAIAAAAKAKVCHIFTDVDGIFSADPNVVDEAK